MRREVQRHVGVLDGDALAALRVVRVELRAVAACAGRRRRETAAALSRTRSRLDGHVDGVGAPRLRVDGIDATASSSHSFSALSH